MATFALTDAFLWVAGYDFTGDSNEIMLSCEGDQLDVTTFGSGGWRESIIGLKTSTLNAAGFWQGDTVDPAVFDNLGVGGEVTTASTMQTEGERAYLLKAMKHNYTPFGGPVGEVAGYSMQGSCSDGVGVVQGLLAKESGTVSATGATGTALELGAVSSGQTLYASFHVFTAGTTITAVIQSDTEEAFGDTPETRISFTGVTSAGGSWGTDPGAHADTWYRLNVTGITGSFVIGCAIGIQ